MIDLREMIWMLIQLKSLCNYLKYHKRLRKKVENIIKITESMIKDAKINYPIKIEKWNKIFIGYYHMLSSVREEIFRKVFLRFTVTSEKIR